MTVSVAGNTLFSWDGFSTKDWNNGLETREVSPSSGLVSASADLLNASVGFEIANFGPIW